MIVTNKNNISIIVIWYDTDVIYPRADHECSKTQIIKIRLKR